MPGPSEAHDRDATAVDREPTPALAEALGRLRLSGAIFLHGVYTESWAYESYPAKDAAAVLAPGSERVILFHVIASGRSWIETLDGDRHWADAGDVIVLPYGHAHRMGGEQPAQIVSMTTLLEPPPWSEMPMIRHGSGGAPTHVVCGYLTCDHPLFDPRLQALPPVFVVRPEGSARDWVRASIDYAAAQTTEVTDTHFEHSPRLPELLLVEMLRLHFARTPIDVGWVRALSDPVLAPVLAAMHGAPEQKWDLISLARIANVSVSLLDERFRALLGLAPIRYLTVWRMHVAGELLQSSELSVAAIARRVGYDSEEAFSRAFKREQGAPPSAWRLTVG
jgi:AraC-like DNA-binding protein